MECAIVTTDAGGIKQVIRDGVDGKMVAVDEWTMLSNELRDLRSNRAQCKTFGPAARARVEETFGLDRMVHALQDIYHYYGQANR